MENSIKSVLNSVIKNDIDNCEIMEFDSEEMCAVNLLRNLNVQWDRNLHCDLVLITDIDGTE